MPLDSLRLFQEAIGDRYALERELGRGGMGRVWLARDLRLDRPVAIKVLHPELAADPTSRERFLREARHAALLAHPHIVPVFSVESSGDLSFLVMAMIDGETLGARVRRRGPLPSDDVEHVMRQVGSALGYAHARGVIHRDLTPENILIERETDRALLVDFGLSRLESDESDAALGTPGYVAPEVIRGRPATARSDLYALGAVGWFALTGAPPHGGATPGETLARQLVQPLPELPAGTTGASRRLVDLLRGCLVSDPDARLQGTAAIMARLDRAPPSAALAPAIREWFTRWDRIRVGYAIATPVLALQMLALMEMYLSRGGAAMQWAAMINWLFATILLPAAANLAAELASLRRLAARGFGIGDIRAAWDQWTAVLREEHRRAGLAPLASRVILDLTVVGATVLVIGVLFGTFLLPIVVAPGELGVTRIALMRLASWVLLGTAAGLSINFLAPGARLSPDGVLRRISRWFWCGPVAGLFARITRAGLTRTVASTRTLHRNTELVLGLAIETLWNALPPEQRKLHTDVPATAATLQHGAEELRRVRKEVLDAQAALPGDDAEWARLEAIAQQLDARHRDAVTRLETLRLHLLRSVSLRTITTDLEAEIALAHEAERTLLHGIAGAAAVRKAIGKSRRRELVTPNPTPSPVTP